MRKWEERGRRWVQAGIEPTTHLFLVQCVTNRQHTCSECDIRNSEIKEDSDSYIRNRLFIADTPPVPPCSRPIQMLGLYCLLVTFVCVTRLKMNVISCCEWTEARKPPCLWHSLAASGLVGNNKCIDWGMPHVSFKYHDTNIADQNYLEY